MTVDELEETDKVERLLADLECVQIGGALVEWY